MNLKQMTMKKLLALLNEIADKPAGPKTFSTRGKLVARIGQIAEAKNIRGDTHPTKRSEEAYRQRHRHARPRDPDGSHGLSVRASGRDGERAD